MIMITKTIYFYVDKINFNFPGFKIISDKILKLIPHSKIITDFTKLNKNEIVIPIGVVASNNLVKSKRDCQISFLVDAPTLCFRSIIMFYLRRRIFHSDILMQLIRLIKYSSIEKRILRKFEKVIVVSSYDQSYLEAKYHKNNVLTISNGVDIKSSAVKVEASFKPRLGFLYFWGVRNSIDDIDWFVRSYVPKLRMVFPELEIIAAGKGANSEVLSYFKKFNISYMGEVNNLSEFYSEIDVYITTVRKESGILNKVLDAMAHKKIVVALKGNMMAFDRLENGYYYYNNVDELIASLKDIEGNSSKVNTFIDNSYEYLKKYHDWEKNYRQLFSLIKVSYDL